LPDGVLKLTPDLDLEPRPRTSIDAEPQRRGVGRTGDAVVRRYGVEIDEIVG